MSRSRRRRGPLRPVPLAAAMAAVGAAAAVALVVAQNGPGVTIHDAADSAVPLAASYQAGTGWGTMIGVNDTSDEVFTVANAQQLAAFAASKHLAWLSMWSAARDTECPGGAQGFAQPTCSSIVQAPDQFMDALGAY